MNLIKNVYEIAEQFMDKPKHAWINDINKYYIELEAEKMIEEGPPIFPIPDKDEDTHKAILMELVASSINYCYWYGKSTIRPKESSSTKMYELLMNAFSGYSEHADDFTECVFRFMGNLTLNRFPLLEERHNHLKQLFHHGERFAEMVNKNHDTYSINKLMKEMILMFPGFGSDIFLKRASLFFIQLYRRFGWFKEGLNYLFVPSDYQIPKMLWSKSLINYNNNLALKIDNHQLIQKNSLEECEIRAATIIAMRELCKITGWNIAEVDGYFFLKRHEANTNFHLTITTDY